MTKAPKGGVISRPFPSPSHTAPSAQHPPKPAHLPNTLRLLLARHMRRAKLSGDQVQDGDSLWQKTRRPLLPAVARKTGPLQGKEPSQTSKEPQREGASPPSGGIVPPGRSLLKPFHDSLGETICIN